MSATRGRERVLAVRSRTIARALTPRLHPPSLPSSFPSHTRFAGHLNMHKSRRRVNALGANKAVLQPSIRKRYLRMLGM